MDYTTKDLADLIFPNLPYTIEDLNKMFPPRNLKDGAMVTRFAPSPTGFLHTGSLFTALVAQKAAKQSGGVFYVRLEDTDSKREVAGSSKELLEQLKEFDVVPDEGYLGDGEKGQYGPYQQSKRADIYKAVIKELIIKGRAYPCFCSVDDLNRLRETQERNKQIPGYYGRYASCRSLTLEQQITRIKNGDPYVIRFRSLGNHNHKIEVTDLVRGRLFLAQNDQDIVILKSDGLPTYHFAHLVDDHFMHTTVVSRGEEWLSSLPLHLELFETMGWEPPHYAHLPVIMKLDNGNKRKLSKRKDDEAAISFFLKDGYPKEAIIEYLFTIANSNYEEWHAKNPSLTFEDFHFTFEKMSLDGALFDLSKLQFLAKETMVKFSPKEMKDKALAYAKQYNPELERVILSNPDYFEQIMAIEKDKENPRKDYMKYSELLDKNRFFYNEFFEEMAKEATPFNSTFPKEVIVSVLQEFADTLNFEVPEQEWFEGLKKLANKHNFADNNKIYKANKETYIGHVGDVAEMIRIALTTSKQSPNLYYILKILGKEEVKRRIKLAIEKL